MVFTRGLPSDFDHWVELGAKGWGWSDLLPYFKATQKQLRPGMNPDYHGYDGEQRVTDVNHGCDELSHDYVKAVVESGLAQETDDFNGSTLEGVGIYQTYQTGTGKRFGGAHAFLHPIKHRSNLTIYTKTLAEKIVFEGKDAVGVQCDVNGTRELLKANKEVIVSSGSINSPQLLMLSGVGDQEELAAHDVPLVHHLPGVGKNLSDHLDIIVNTTVREFKGIGISIPFVCRMAVDLVKYVINGTGKLATNGAEAGGFIKSDPDLAEPNIQMHFSPSMLERHFIRRMAHGHGLHLCNLQPKSRGFVALKSNKPTDKPAIQFNYCEHPDDMDVMVKCVKLARKIMASPSLLKSEKKMVKPSSDVQSDEEIKEFIRQHSETVYHPVGTCKMGVDDMAVVDTELRVHGLKKLRVVDASIMPTLNSGNTHSNVIAIADKAAGLILNASNETEATVS
ncbi:MAG: GMC oxidoreductase [Pseudomonadota bacterium]